MEKKTEKEEYLSVHKKLRLIYNDLPSVIRNSTVGESILNGIYLTRRKIIEIDKKNNGRKQI